AMLTLAVECATKTVGIALLDEEDVQAEIYLGLGRHHAEVLLPAIDRLFLMTGLAPADVDLLACTVGPGSFTGLRIGVSTIKGLALGMGKPVVGVSTLETLAMNAIPSSRLICPMLDARKGQVYTGVYRMGPDTRPQAVRPERLADAAQFLRELDQDGIVFLGDGAIRNEQLIREAGKGWNILCGSSRQRLMASAVGLIGLQQYRCGHVVNTLTFAPRYLRLSEAETNCAPRAPLCSGEPDRC
ncbi:MAG: tRNA (adenosine(37)-N6)-threonylcarbamoyltransferase complex dimerization subunit type 1 TsaB, partial [Syntrophales bacterium]